jgi:chitinase
MKSPTVLGYWTDWNPDFPPDKVPWASLTHLCHAFSLVGEDGLLRPLTGEPTITRLISLGRKHQVPVLLSLGGGTNSEVLSRTITTPERVSALADAVAARVKTLGYAGVDVDWEGIQTAPQQASLESLVAALRQRLPRPLLLTQAVGAGTWGNEYVDSKKLLPPIDFLNLMTYDFSGPWSPVAGHNAPFRFCQSAIALWHGKLGWPKSKLNLGIPLYGRGFRASALDEKTTGDYERSYIDLKEVEKLRGAGWERRRDPAEKVPYLLRPGGGELISYEDAASARHKATWARQQGLGGIFFWELSGDHADRAQSVLQAACSVVKETA